MLEKFSPFGIADSKIKTAVAPDPETKSQPLLLSFGTGEVNTPWYDLVITPIQFGPMRHPPDLFIRSVISFSSFNPSLPDSLNPAEIIINALVFLSFTSILTTGKHDAAEIASMARSVSGISFTSL